MRFLIWEAMRWVQSDDFIDNERIYSETASTFYKFYHILNASFLSKGAGSFLKHLILFACSSHV